ncbi:MAG: hypothetical protein GTO45_32410 [Candidatus Aminicenantes bacterium]|nr:hypothetical protein [Candidatus Aminicenantes bacterium]NIM83454.1 hypothetical protein [Candidatus Aminicenantes bacterium]NIN22846.1 hypothetical protein [Candidatus Aminicenantes bacterium]NIN46582.1 hypothetical protein [Candidatus Aminicenantes bacterium]NIN89485.1 hypothetical protein [Candidatus Aminicenantes bacterium]
MAKKRRIQDIYNLSPMQSGMLFYWLKDKNSKAYFEQTTLTVKGKIDPRLFERCFIKLIERYDNLKNSFSLREIITPQAICFSQSKI